MSIALTEVFNSSGEVYGWISNSTTNMTGSVFLSVLIMIALFILAMLLFKMPELLIGLILFPLVLVLLAVGEISTEMKIIVGILTLIIGLGVYAFYPSK